MSIPDDVKPVLPTAAAESEGLLELELTKKQLEVQKLRDEVAAAADARHWFKKAVRDVKLSEWLTAGAAILALAVGYWSGFFNAVRDKLSAQADRLEMEKLHLQDQKAVLDNQLSGKQSELDALQLRLSPYESETQALEKLRDASRSNVRVVVESSMLGWPKGDGIKASFDYFPAEGKMPAYDRNAALKPNRVAVLGDAVEQASRFRQLKRLRIYNLACGRDELEAASKCSNLDWARFRFCGIDSSGLGGFSPPPRLQRLDLDENAIVSLVMLKPCPQVKHLSLSHNPLTDDGVGVIVSSFPELEILSLDQTQITDEGVTQLAKLPKLRVLDLRSTKVTERGVIRSLDCPKLETLWADKATVTDEARAGASRLGRRVSLIDEPKFLDWTMLGITDPDW